MADKPYFDWRTRSLCATLSPQAYEGLFFPEAGRTVNEAKKFCSRCPVVTECLEFALANNERGIWAGTNYVERQRMSRFKTHAATSAVMARTRAKPKRTFTFS